jgi:type IV pilus assembly protein PilY1
MYDAALAGTTSGCGAGVKGQSFTKRLCLPTGVCPEDADYTYNLGSGIVSVTVGPDGKGGRVIIVPEPNPDSI